MKKVVFDMPPQQIDALMQRAAMTLEERAIESLRTRDAADWVRSNPEYVMTPENNRLMDEYIGELGVTRDEAFRELSSLGALKHE